MNYIEVDSRGCGVGKTRNTIIPRIKKNIRMGIKTLVVVPSLDLQREYAKLIDIDYITIINSERNQRIYEQYQQADTPVICITHQGFLQTPHYLFEKENWDLVIDEALDPFASLTFKTYDGAGRVWINFDELVSWSTPELVPQNKPTTNPQPYFKLDFCESTAPDIIDRQLWQKLSNPNYTKWATWEIGNNLMTNAAETSTIQLALNPMMFENWSSVWIAAAVFEKTLMSHWLVANGLDYTVIHPFERHTSPSVWHIPQDEFSWSKNYKRNNPNIEQIFRDYIAKNRTGKVIYNKNNDSTVAITFGQLINHNAHGINGYSHLANYAFMSAIKPHPQFRNFVVNYCGLDYKQLEFGFAGYMAYQLLMRSALRDPNNTTPVNLFFLDTTQALEVMDLFDPQSYEVKFIEEIKGNKSKPLTPAERAKNYRAKQKLTHSKE